MRVLNRASTRFHNSVSGRTRSPKEPDKIDLHDSTIVPTRFHGMQSQRRRTN